jgi:hypothetical protein
MALPLHFKAQRIEAGWTFGSGMNFLDRVRIEGSDSEPVRALKGQFVNIGTYWQTALSRRLRIRLEQRQVIRTLFLNQPWTCRNTLTDEVQVRVAEYSGVDFSVEIPLLVGYRLNEHVYVEVGGVYTCLLIPAELRRNDLFDDCYHPFVSSRPSWLAPGERNRNEASVIAGAYYKLPNGLCVSIRYMRAVTGAGYERDEREPHSVRFYYNLVGLQMSYPFR